MPQKKTNSNTSEKPKNAYFLSLELENIRCFGEKQKIDFSDGNDNPRQWTIILGDNGTGKTTILQSLVAMLPMPDRLGVTPKYTVYDLPFNWTPTRKKEGKLFASFSISDFGKNISNNIFEYDLKISPPEFDVAFWSKGFVSSLLNENLAVNCFGYGASRRMHDSVIIEFTESQPYESLFSDFIYLQNAESWLIKSDYAASKTSSIQLKAIKKRDDVIKILIRVLPDISDIRFSQSQVPPFNTKVEFKTPYGWVESRSLSDGYRTSMAWMVDFASRMFDLYPESENPLAEPAVVLIDEIDLHLHPKWQRDLLPWLSELFPNTQFIVTTHSPLIVQSAVARDANIVVCRREGDHVVIDQSVEAVKNWRADQILTSDFFGLETARPKEIEKDLLERQEILSKAKLTKKDEKRLKMLESEIGFMPVSENSDDDKAMDIIRRAAERLQSEAK